MPKDITVFISQRVNNNINYIGSYEVKAGATEPLRIKALNNTTYQLARSDSGFSVENADFKQINNDLYISVNGSDNADIIIEDYYINQGEITGFPQSSVISPTNTAVSTAHQPIVAEQIAATEFSEGLSDGLSGSAMLKILGGVLGAGAIAAFALGGGGSGGKGNNNRSQSAGNTDNQGSSSENNPQNYPNGVSPNNNSSKTSPSSDGEPIKTTVTVYYPNGEVITYETTTANPFSYENIQYIVDAPNFAPLEQINAYFAQNPLTAQDITDAYKTDTDNDGVIDLHDKNPTKWDVSNRDLRMFSTLAYSDEDELKAIFKQHSESAISKINNDSDKFNKVADVQELSKNWKLLRAVDAGHGLQYAIFGNGEKTEGGYENVVVAFRGTDKKIGSNSDLGDDLAIWAGWIPEQAEMLPQVIQHIKEYNPTHIYSTGHSLGGYLAQWFAAHNIKTSGLEHKFEHSSLFNPVILKTRWYSNSDLEKAKNLSDLMTQEMKIDDSDTTNIITNNYKTNSYVIKDEFAGDLFGNYKNTQFFDFKKDELWGKHSLSSFYEQDHKLKTTFSKGYRMDSHYLKLDSDSDGLTDVAEKHIGTNLNMLDSDGDGFSDALEVKIGSDPLNAKFTPYTVNNSIKVTVKTVTENGTSHEQEVTLRAEQDNNRLVYKIGDEQPINLNVKSPAFTKISDGTPFILGSPNDDVLFTSEGKAILQGGAGKDKFVFNTALNGTIDQLLDFSNEDKIALSNQVFSAIKTDLSNYQDHLFYDKASGQLSYNQSNTGSSEASVFAALPTNLDLNKNNFEIV